MSPKTKMEKIKTLNKPTYDFGILLKQEPEEKITFPEGSFNKLKDVPYYENLIENGNYDQVLKLMKKHSASCNINIHNFETLEEAAYHSLLLIKNCITFEHIPTEDPLQKEYNKCLTHPAILRYKTKYSKGVTKKNISQTIDDMKKIIKIYTDNHYVGYEAINNGDYETAMMCKRSFVQSRLQIIFPDDLKSSTNVEISIFNKTIVNAEKDNTPLNWKSKQFRQLYAFIFRKIIANLTYTPNANDLLLKIESKQIKATDLVNMTNDELYPEMAEKHRHRRAHYSELVRKADALKTSGEVNCMYPCIRCKSKYVDYTERQTRSADEPMTIFLRCLKCEKRWRM